MSLSLSSSNNFSIQVIVLFKFQVHNSKIIWLLDKFVQLYNIKVKFILVINYCITYKNPLIKNLFNFAVVEYQSHSKVLKRWAAFYLRSLRATFKEKLVRLVGMIIMFYVDVSLIHIASELLAYNLFLHFPSLPTFMTCCGQADKNTGL